MKAKSVIINVFKIGCIIFSSVLLVCMLTLCRSDLWPPKYWWTANFILIFPLWLFLFPAALGLLSSPFAKSRSVATINIFSILIIIFGLMGFNVPSPRIFPPKNKNTITVVSVNLGSWKRIFDLVNYIVDQDPDVILLQESGDWFMDYLRKVPQKDWHTYYSGGLGLISRYKIISASPLKKRGMRRSGEFAAEYLIEGPYGPLRLINVHFETPRGGLEAIIRGGPRAYGEMKKITDRQRNESFLASGLAANKNNIIVAGDFNMTAANPIFRKDWSGFQDAFLKTGWGFGYSKFTGWHGLRIDRILTNKGWEVLESGVGPDFGGDHRPIIAKLAFVGEPEEYTAQPITKVVQKPFSSKDAYKYEDFESKVLGKGFYSEGAYISFDYEPALGYSLVSQINADAKDMKLKLPLAGWSMENYPRIQFMYKLEPSTPLVVRVLTRFNDWICLGATTSTQCPNTKSAEYFTLIDDGKWHHIDINVFSSVRSVLKSLSNIKEWQFYMPRNRNLADKFTIDNFIITK